MGQTESKKSNNSESNKSNNYKRYYGINFMPTRLNRINDLTNSRTNTVYIGSVANLLSSEAQKHEDMKKLCEETITKIKDLETSLKNFKSKYKEDIFDKITTITGEYNAQTKKTLYKYEYKGNPEMINKTSQFISDYKKLYTENGLLYDNYNELNTYNKKNRKLVCYTNLKTAESSLFNISKDLLSIKYQLSQFLTGGGSRKRSLKKRKHSKCKRTRRR